jgi:Uma2 family endonuclease
MSTLVLGTPPPELRALLERRRKSGLDRSDEVWAGVYHMVPAPSHAHGDVESQLHVILRALAGQRGLTMTGQFNLGVSEQDFRVPDGGLHRPGAGGIWHPTAALVIEVVSPDDETRQKLPFFAAHNVDEVLLVDPAARLVDWLTLGGDGYGPLKRSGLIELGPSELAARIDWP